MSRDITNEDLVKVKRMGPGKVSAVRELIDDTPNPKALTASDFASIPGVSEDMGAELVKLVDDPDSYTPQAPTPRKVAKKATRKTASPEGTLKRAKKATAKKATAKKATAKTKRTPRASSNGNSRSVVSAFEVRQFAREAERFGLSDVATTLRSSVAALNDDERIKTSELVSS